MYHMLHVSVRWPPFWPIFKGGHRHATTDDDHRDQHYERHAGGTHFCYFYETKQGLLDASVPFFQAGLENGEFCLWIVYAPITEADAFQALREANPAWDPYHAEGAMEIWVYPEPFQRLPVILQACA
jgi:MEDS: MEthanogen/methylotroph, DcmR Sensory domain